MSVYAKMISSWVRKVLGTAKSHMSPGTVQGAVVLAAFAAGISPVFSLEEATGSVFLPQPDTIFQHTSLLQIGTRIPYSMLSSASVSSQPVGNCQPLTYIKSCGYVGLLGHSSPQHQANSSPIVCVVIVLDIWNY